MIVHVSAAPDPHRIRAAIAEALAGRSPGAGPEAQLAHAVVREVAGRTGGRT